MSNYNLKAKNRESGIVEDFIALDNYYGRCKYGYMTNDELRKVCGEDQFNKLYQIVEDPNHPYGGMEVDSIMPIKGNDTWEDRFNMEFVDEDTGLLNIGKYDHERIINFFNREINDKTS